MGWVCGAYGRGEGVYRVLVGKPEGRIPLGRPRRRWVDNIRMDLQEMGCGYMDWIGLDQDRERWRTLVSEVMNLRVLWNAGNFLTNCKPVSFSRRTLHHGVSKLQHMVFCTEFVDGWWSWEPLRRSCVRCGWCRASRTAPSAPYTQPTQLLSRPPSIHKLGAENYMLQLNI